MTEKDLRRLNRAELLEMLVDQSRELQDLREKLAEAETALENREISITEAGSIAEASLILNGVFDAAQHACDQYIENIRQLSEKQASICARLEMESREKADQILAEAEENRITMEAETKAHCEDLVRKAEQESKKYWDDVSDKLEVFYEAHAGLRELLPTLLLQKE